MMKMITNPDGTISSSRLFNVLIWAGVFLKFMFPNIFGELDITTAASLLTISNGSYVIRAHSQGKHGKDDPKGGEA